MKEDNRVDVTVDIADKTFIILAKEAHRKDITFNDFVNETLRKYIVKEKQSIAIKDLGTIEIKDDLNELVDEII